MIENPNNFLKVTEHTDAKDLAYLYDDIPNEIDLICKTVNALLIHPARLDQYPNLEVNEDEIWDHEPRTVYNILVKLTEKNKDGLLAQREDKDKVIITCRGFTILLTSILRYKGIPARARAGFAPYICEGVNIGHWICEYWDAEQKRWILLDADFMKIDFSADEFRYAADVYQDCLNSKDNPFTYGGIDYWGMCNIISFLNLDLLSLVYDELWYDPKTYITEKLIWEKQTTYEKAVQKFSSDEKKLLDQAKNLMINLEANYHELMDFVNSNIKLLPIK